MPKNDVNRIKLFIRQINSVAALRISIFLSCSVMFLNVSVFIYLTAPDRQRRPLGVVRRHQVVVLR